jgi:hypothetical protein
MEFLTNGKGTHFARMQPQNLCCYSIFLVTTTKDGFLFSFFVVVALLFINAIGRTNYNAARNALSRAKAKARDTWLDGATAKGFTELPLEYVVRPFVAYGVELEAVEVFYNLEYLVTPSNMHQQKEATKLRENTQTPILKELPTIVQVSGNDFAGSFEFTDGGKECELIGKELEYKNLDVLQFIKTSWYGGLTVTQIIGEGRKKGFKMPSERTIYSLAASYNWKEKRLIRDENTPSSTA